LVEGTPARARRTRDDPVGIGLVAAVATMVVATAEVRERLGNTEDEEMIVSQGLMLLGALVVDDRMAGQAAGDVAGLVTTVFAMAQDWLATDSSSPMPPNVSAGLLGALQLATAFSYDERFVAQVATDRHVRTLLGAVDATAPTSDEHRVWVARALAHVVRASAGAKVVAAVFTHEHAFGLVALLGSSHATLVAELCTLLGALASVGEAHCLLLTSGAVESLVAGLSSPESAATDAIVGALARLLSRESGRPDAVASGFAAVLAANGVASLGEVLRSGPESSMSVVLSLLHALLSLDDTASATAATLLYGATSGLQRALTIATPDSAAAAATATSSLTAPIPTSVAAAAAVASLTGSPSASPSSSSSSPSSSSSASSSSSSPRSRAISLINLLVVLQPDIAKDELGAGKIVESLASIGNAESLKSLSFLTEGHQDNALRLAQSGALAEVVASLAAGAARDESVAPQALDAAAFLVGLPGLAALVDTAGPPTLEVLVSGCLASLAVSHSPTTKGMVASLLLTVCRDSPESVHLVLRQPQGLAALAAALTSSEEKTVTRVAGIVRVVAGTERGREALAASAVVPFLGNVCRTDAPRLTAPLRQAFASAILALLPSYSCQVSFARAGGVQGLVLLGRSAPQPVSRSTLPPTDGNRSPLTTREDGSLADDGRDLTRVSVVRALALLCVQESNRRVAAEVGIVALLTELLFLSDARDDALQTLALFDKEIAADARLVEDLTRAGGLIALTSLLQDAGAAPRSDRQAVAAVGRAAALLGSLASNPKVRADLATLDTVRALVAGLGAVGGHEEEEQSLVWTLSLLSAQPDLAAEVAASNVATALLSRLRPLLALGRGSAACASSALIVVNLSSADPQLFPTFVTSSGTATLVSLLGSSVQQALHMALDFVVALNPSADATLMAEVVGNGGVSPLAALITSPAVAESASAQQLAHKALVAVLNLADTQGRLVDSLVADTATVAAIVRLMGAESPLEPAARRAATRAMRLVASTASGATAMFALPCVNQVVALAFSPDAMQRATCADILHAMLAGGEDESDVSALLTRLALGSSTSSLSSSTSSSSSPALTASSSSSSLVRRATALRDAGGIVALLTLMGSAAREVQLASVRVLALLSQLIPSAASDVLEHDGLRPTMRMLVQCAGSTGDSLALDVAVAAVSLLASLSTSPAFSSAVGAADALPALVSLAVGTGRTVSTVQMHALVAVAGFVRAPSNRESAVHAGVLEIVVDLVCSGPALLSDAEAAEAGTGEGEREGGEEVGEVDVGAERRREREREAAAARAEEEDEDAKLAALLTSGPSAPPADSDVSDGEEEGEEEEGVAAGERKEKEVAGEEEEEEAELVAAASRRAAARHRRLRADTSLGGSGRREGGVESRPGVVSLCSALSILSYVSTIVASADETRDAVVRAAEDTAVISALVALLTSGNRSVAREAARALGAVCRVTDVAAARATDGGAAHAVVELLVNGHELPTKRSVARFLEAGERSLTGWCAALVSHLASSVEGHTELWKLGAVDALVTLLEAGIDAGKDGRDKALVLRALSRLAPRRSTSGSADTEAPPENPALAGRLGYVCASLLSAPSVRPVAFTTIDNWMAASSRQCRDRIAKSIVTAVAVDDTVVAQCRGGAAESDTDALVVELFDAVGVDVLG
jgi:hypothetical protein